MRILVTGGTGFLGTHLCRQLRQAGHEVTALGRNREAGERLEAEGVRFVRGDLAHDLNACRLAASRQDVVIHSAALSSPWGDRRDFFLANVLGTRHIVAASRASGVRRFVHVSTPSLYFDGKDRRGILEGDPMPERYLCHYSETKRRAEEVVDAERGDMETVVLRPRGIFGPGDTTIFPRLLAAHREGRLRVIGSGKNVVDLTYVENAASACVLAATAGRRAVGGVFNITNGESVELWPFIGTLFGRLGLAWPPKRVPFRLAYLMAAAMEVRARRKEGQPEPPLTRYTVALLARSQTLDISAARELLGYEPAVSMDEGLERFAQWLAPQMATGGAAGTRP
jgi:nucleoside-diphosphate-sugar epimerase